jgi:hypothetical protein
LIKFWTNFPQNNLHKFIQVLCTIILDFKVF